MSHYNDPEPTTITTCDGHTVEVGDIVHNYYDCKTGEIRDIGHGDVANDGWARLTDGAGFVNGERMCRKCTICGYDWQQDQPRDLVEIVAGCESGSMAEFEIHKRDCKKIANGGRAELQRYELSHRMTVAEHIAAEVVCYQESDQGWTAEDFHVCKCVPNDEVETAAVSAPMEEARADYIAVEADTELVRVKDLKPGDVSPFYGTFLEIEDHPRRSNSHPDENGGCYVVRAYFVDYEWPQLDFMRDLISFDTDGRAYWSLQGNNLAGFRRVVPAL